MLDHPPKNGVFSSKSTFWWTSILEISMVRVGPLSYNFLIYGIFISKLPLFIQPGWSSIF